MPMKLKLDEDGHVVVQDNKAVWIAEDGKEIVYDPDYSNATIARLNNENKEHREKAAENAERLKAFEGIEDPAKALEAIQTVANLGSGELKTAAQVQEIRDQAKKAAEEQVREAAKASQVEIAALKQDIEATRVELHDEKIGNSFDRSVYIETKVAVPRDLIRDKFGKNFKYEEKRTVGYDAAGNKIYSRSKPGELAEFDEALEILIDAYPHKDQILKGVNQNGSGTDHPKGPGGGDRPKGNLGGNPAERTEALRARFPELDKHQ